MPVVEVHYFFKGIFEDSQVLSSCFIRIFSCLQIFTAEKHISISQSCTVETDTNCHTNKVLRVNLHNLIVGCSVLRDSGILAELRNLVVNIFFVNSNQGLNKVVLIQVLTARVDTNKDICHILLVRIYGDFQSRK